MLVVAAIAKRMDFAAFEDSMRLSMLFPTPFRPILGHLLIVGEMALGVWLLSGFHVVRAYLAVMLLSSLFTGYALWRYRMGIPSPCHCLGPLAQLGPVQSLIFASSFWALATFSYVATALTRPDRAFARL